MVNYSEHGYKSRQIIIDKFWDKLEEAKVVKWTFGERDDLSEPTVNFICGILQQVYDAGYLYARSEDR